MKKGFLLTLVVVIASICGAAGMGEAHRDCFCLVRADDPQGRLLRDCEEFKAPGDLYPTAVCTDSNGQVVRHLVTESWLRIYENEGRCTPCRLESESTERGGPNLEAYAVEKLREASIAFNAPSTMTVGKSENMRLVLDLDRNIADLFRYIAEEGERRGFKIYVSDRMEANLKGETFDVNALNPAEQPILGKQPTEWLWQVTPLKAGRHYLFLTLNAFMEVRGVEKPKTVRTFDQKIDVRVRPIGERAEEFVSRNWQWLWTGVLVPIVGLLWSVRIKRRRRV